MFPHTTYEKIDRSAARHLYRLLQRYNWSLEDPNRYLERWACFWPSISVLERKALAMLVMANCQGGFGMRLEIADTPVELEPFEGHAEPVAMSTRVKAELERLVAMYYASLASVDEVTAMFGNERPDAFDAFVNVGGMKLLYDDVGMHPLVFRDRAHSAFLDAGIEEERATCFANSLDLALQNFLIAREVQAWH